METRLSETTLRDGRRAELLCIQPPAERWRERIAAFLSHKGEPWNWHIATHLDGRNDRLEQRFFIAVDGERILGHLMVVEKHGVAILGHVFTDPAWRNQGVTTALMRAMTEDFAARDGIAMHLYTGFESQAFRIYNRFGFTPIRAGSGLMKWVRRPDRFDAMFDPGPVRVEPVCWTHWPLVHKLMLRDEGDWLRSSALTLVGSCSAENAFVDLMSRLRAGPPQAGAVLVNQAGMTVGLATLLPYRSLPGRLMEFDVYVHPSTSDHIDLLVGSIELPVDRPVLAQIDSESPQRHRALLDAGFREVARLRRALTADGRDLDLAVLQIARD